MARVSTVLITLNEEHQIERALRSVMWTHEQIVVDSFSRDRTVEIAASLGARVLQREYPGSTRQMEYGVEACTGDWVLFLDADEEVSGALADEIQATLAGDCSFSAFEILREPKAFGKWIRHGGWYPDFQVRLLRKDAYTVNHAEVHGGFGTAGRTGRLKAPVHHYTYENVYSYVSKMNDYTSLEVSNRLSSRPGVQWGWHRIILSPLSHFLRMFVSRRGYRDGMHGFVLAVLDAVYALLLYVKLWEYRNAAETGRPAPPITNKDLNRIKRTV